MPQEADGAQRKRITTTIIKHSAHDKVRKRKEADARTNTRASSDGSHALATVKGNPALASAEEKDVTTCEATSFLNTHLKTDAMFCVSKVTIEDIGLPTRTKSAEEIDETTRKQRNPVTLV